MPRPIQRKQSSDKRRLDAQDVLALFYFLDGKQFQLPAFTAGNLRRIPPFNPSDSDVCTLATSLCSLRAEVESLVSLKNELEDLRSIRAELSAITDLKKSVSELKSMVKSTTSTATPLECQLTLPAALSSSSSTTHDCSSVTEPPVGTSQESDPVDSELAGWATVTSRHRPVTAKPVTTARHVPPPVRIKGSRNDGSLKSVPRRQVLAAYVGRLHTETSEE